MGKKLETGKEGIEEVRGELLRIDAENARAFRKADEVAVKDHIKNSLGFTAVNRAVARSMMTWIGDVVGDHFQKLTEAPSDPHAFSDSTIRLSFQQPMILRMDRDCAN